MSSSTSNFSSESTDSMNATPTNDSPRKIYLKIVLTMIIGSACSLAIIRGFTFMNDASGDSFLGRVLESKAGLSKVVKEEKDLVIFYGSSMTGAGFSPRQFDKAMQEKNVNIKSFNYGFGGLNPFFQDIYSRRIREAFQQNNRRLELAILEFNPFQTTITRHDRAISLKDSFEVLLASNKEIMDITMQDPTRGIRLLTIKHLRDGVSAEMITGFFGGEFSIPRSRTEIPEDEDLVKKYSEIEGLLNEAFEKEYPNYDGAQWSYDWQGAGTIPEERSDETLELFDQYYHLQNQNNHQYDDDRLSRIASADIIELNFSDELVEAYIRLIKNFQQFSNKVEVVLLPRNTKWITNSPEGLQRLNETIKKIENATGITMKNHQDLDVMKPSMFRDTTHLNRYKGSVTYTNYLIEQYAEYLKNSN